MSQMKYRILESWPALKKDLSSLLSDTDAWTIAELRQAHEDEDWVKVLNVIDVMELIHSMSHSH